MGASQSTGAAEEQSGEIKTSYYELLSVERGASQDEYDVPTLMYLFTC